MHNKQWLCSKALSTALIGSILTETTTLMMCVSNKPYIFVLFIRCNSFFMINSIIKYIYNQHLFFVFVILKKSWIFIH